MKDVFTKRRKKLVEILRAKKLGAAAFVPGPNFYYLTGLNFHLMERPTILLVTDAGEVLAVIPELERIKWSASFPDALTFYWQDSVGYDGAFENAAAELGAKKIGIEAGRMRAFEADALRRHMGQGGIEDAETALAGLRLAKDAGEIQRIERAIAISEAALGETVEEIKAGMSEREVLQRLSMRMLANGADGLAFDPIVLVGGNSANPHGSPGDTILQPGDPLLIDFGARLDGYSADITRTFFCEYASDKHADIYQTVLAANTKGRDVADPDLSAHDLDREVTGILANSPYSDLIVHKTGHGLGLDIHEAPQVMEGNHEPLVPGTVLTIEPGLYRIEEIGVRIEDDVLIEAAGSRSLTTFDRDLTIVGR